MMFSNLMQPAFSQIDGKDADGKPKESAMYSALKERLKNMPPEKTISAGLVKYFTTEKTDYNSGALLFNNDESRQMFNKLYKEDQNLGDRLANAARNTTGDNRSSGYIAVVSKKVPIPDTANPNRKDIIIDKRQYNENTDAVGEFGKLRKTKVVTDTKITEQNTGSSILQDKPRSKKNNNAPTP